MTGNNQVEKTLGEQMTDLLSRKPKNYDVIFSVGQDKTKVEAVKFVLKAASPVFEAEFEEKWENAVMKEDEGIPLPDVDPTAFRIFVNLLILDKWSVDSVKSLSLLSPNNLLNLLGLCRRYEITKAIKSLEEAANDFIQSFDKYKDTKELLKISQVNLETIFSFEGIPLDETEIFNCACRWACNQCKIKGLEPTGQNYREVLGGSLFEIRFPTMSTEEFTNVGLFKKNILSGEEKLAIYEYIGLNIAKRTNYDRTQLRFKTNSRMPFMGCSVLSLPQLNTLATSSVFVCNGSQCNRGFQVSQKISLHGVGFLGSIHEDTYFDVTVRVKRFVDGSCTFASGTFTKNILARKGKILRFLLDEPFIVEPSTYDSSWRDRYRIEFSLKGPNNISQYKVDNPMDESLEASGVTFHLYSGWKHGNPLAKLFFKKI